jgi:hypothetical protein
VGGFAHHHGPHQHQHRRGGNLRDGLGVGVEGGVGGGSRAKERHSSTHIGTAWQSSMVCRGDVYTAVV